MALAALLSRPLFWAALGLLVLLLAALAWRLRLRWRPALALRAGLAALILAGLFLPSGETLRQAVPARSVLVVDQSDSLDPAARLQAQQRAQEWQAAGANRLVVAYGAHPLIVLGPQAPWPAPDGRASEATAALRLAGELLGGTPGRLILASDGAADDPAGVQAALTALQERGHSLQVISLAPRQDPDDGFVGPLSVPANLWAGTPFVALLPVFPPQGATGSTPGGLDLQLMVNGQESNATAEQVTENLYRFRVPAQAEGLLTLEATARFSPAAGDDPSPANNASFATVQVFPAPRVLFLSGQPLPAAAQRFVQLLEDSRLEVDTLAPEALPTDIEQLGQYRVIFLHNLLSSQLNQEGLLSLQVFVSRLAGGLVFLGGRSSYTLGGYGGTLLETLLPVRLEPPPRSERPPITFLLVMDQSSSMGRGLNPRDPAPIDLAREAAMRAIETMQPQDWLGVLTFNDRSHWVVPLRELGGGLALRQALDAVSQVPADGTTYMYQALQEALAAVQGLPAGAPPARHLLVLSDGRSFDGDPEAFRSLASTANAQGMTLSSIAFGEEADEETMEIIAEAGKGRAYSVSDADELPRILIHESQAARSENVQAGQTALKPGEAGHPVLSGLRAGDLPALNGYNALSSRSDQGAEDILVSASFEDPLMSAWQYGLGRVIAWMGDLGEEWSEPWAPETETVFWSQVVRYALANPALGPAQVDVRVESTRLVVEAGLQEPSGAPVDLAEVIFTYADPAGERHAFNLPQSGPGAYRLEIPRPPEGAYRAVVRFSTGSGSAGEIPAPFAVNPPAEWLPQDPAEGALALAAWAELAGGEVIDLEAFAAEDETPAPETEASTGLSPWNLLLAALVLLWPLEIALRRRWMSWR
jgi:uncharacterized membrane protein